MKTPLKITIGYLLIGGLIGAVWPLLNLGPNYPEFQAQSLAYQIGSYARELLISLAFIISSLGLIKYQLWARKVGLFALFFAFLYGGNAIAWGWAGGKPSSNIILYSYVVSFIWYGIWFFILYHKSTIAQLTRPSI